MRQLAPLRARNGRRAKGSDEAPVAVRTASTAATPAEAASGGQKERRKLFLPKRRARNAPTTSGSIPAHSPLPPAAAPSSLLDDMFGEEGGPLDSDLGLFYFEHGSSFGKWVSSLARVPCRPGSRLH